MNLHFADYLVILIYFVFVVAVGFIIKKKITSSNDFLNSNKSIPLWITSIAFISANLGAHTIGFLAYKGDDLVGQYGLGARTWNYH